MKQKKIFLIIYFLFSIIIFTKDYRLTKKRGKEKYNELINQQKNISKEKKTSEIYFNSCKEAKEKGYKNIKKGKAGYRKELDKDGDGIACE